MIYKIKSESGLNSCWFGVNLVLICGDFNDKMKLKKHDQNFFGKFKYEKNEFMT